MNILRFLRAAICQEPEQFRFDTTDSELYIISDIRRAIKKVYPLAQVKIPDNCFMVLLKEEIQRWLDTDPFKGVEYKKTWFDCDDFATRARCLVKQIGRVQEKNFLFAYCEGDTPEGRHAFNLVIDLDVNIWIIEPQSNTMTLSTNSEYEPDFIQF